MNANKLQEKLCKDFLDLDPEDRTTWIRTRNEPERLALWQALSSHPSLTCTMLISLPQPYQAEALRFVCGDPQRGIGGSGRVFFVEPTDKPVEWQVATFLNKRRMIKIDRRMAVPAEQAVCLLYNLGENAPVSLNRGLLREYTEPKASTEPVEPIAKTEASEKPSKK